jgi:hypothetical protein
MNFKDRFKEILLDMVGNWYCCDTDTRRYFVYIYRVVGDRKFEISSFDISAHRYTPGSHKGKLSVAKGNKPAVEIITDYYLIESDDDEVIGELNAILAELLLLQ